MPRVSAGSVDISVCFDVLSYLSSRIGFFFFFGESVIEGNEKPVTINSPGVSRGCVKGSLQSCRGYSYAKRNVKF